MDGPSMNVETGANLTYAKLTPEKVRAIRKSWRLRSVTVQWLATQYNTTRSNIHAIVNRRTWKDVHDE